VTDPGSSLVDPLDPSLPILPPVPSAAPASGGAEEGTPLTAAGIAAAEHAATPPRPPLPEMRTEPVRFPLQWILEHAAPAVQYRALVDVARIPPATAAAQVDVLALAHPSALRCAVTMATDGTWGDRLFPEPGAPAHTATFSAVRHLIECGWHRDTPPLYVARRHLFRLLAQDEEAAPLLELAAVAGASKARVRHLRAIVRDEAAALLAQMGFADDPRVRGAAARGITRVEAYLRSPLAAKPWVRVGNKQVLAAEAAPPTYSLLRLLACIPPLRTEKAALVAFLGRMLSQGEPRQESVQLLDGQLVASPWYVLGDPIPHRNAVDADLFAALAWLETSARLGLLRRSEGWLRMLERLVDQSDRHGLWRPPRADAPAPSTHWALAGWSPLDPTASDAARVAEPTVRIAAIARLLGREIVLT
jgi:hypothetical protein